MPWLPSTGQGLAGWGAPPALHSGGAGELAAAIMRMRQAQQQQAIQSGEQLAGSLAQQMQKRRNDQIAAIQLKNEFGNDPQMQQMLDTGATPTDAYRAMLAKQEGKQADLNTWYKQQLQQAQINRLNAPETPPQLTPDYQDRMRRTQQPWLAFPENLYNTTGMTPEQFAGTTGTKYFPVPAKGTAFNPNDKNQHPVDETTAASNPNAYFALTPQGQSVPLPTWLNLRQQHQTWLQSQGQPGQSPTQQAAQSVQSEPTQQAVNKAPATAINWLRAHPETSDQFDAKYGIGLAASILGQ